MSRPWQRYRFARAAAYRPLSCMRSPVVHRRLTIEPLEGRLLLTGTLWGEPSSGGEGESSSAQVAFRLAVTDVLGNPVEQVAPGADIYLEVYVQDVRAGASPAGIFAAYLDVNYAADLLSIVSSSTNPLGFDIEFGEYYTNGPWGAAETAGLIDEVGAFQTGFQPLGSAEYLLFRTRLTAGHVTLHGDVFSGIAEDANDAKLDVLANDEFNEGTALITSHAADISPAHDVITYSPPRVVPDAEASYGQAAFDIVRTGGSVITSVTQPSSGGTARISDSGTYLLYSPPANFFGTESFTYAVGGARTASVTVNVHAVNDAPVAEDDEYSLGRNEVLEADALRGVLQNDRDVDQDLLAATLVEPPLHGNLLLRPDGSFTYTPAADYVGPDGFVYAVRDPGLALSEGEVQLNVGVPRVSIRLELVDGAGQPLAGVAVGDPLYLRAWVRDLRDDFYPDRGVYATYLDVLFDSADVRPVLDDQLPLGFAIEFGAAFQDPGSGDALEYGVVNEVGSLVVGGDPLGADESLLFEMPFETTGPRALDDDYDVSFQSLKNILDVLANDSQLVWTTAFTAEAADDLPAHEVLLSEPRVAVSAAEILWTGTDVAIANDSDVHIVAVGPASSGGTVTISTLGKELVYTPAAGFAGAESFVYTVADPSGRTAVATVVVDVVRSWQNLRNPLDVNSDTFVSPIDALLVINYLNTGLPNKLVGLPSGAPFRDVNGDGYVSPIDALLVINYLNRQGAGEGESADPPQGAQGAAAYSRQDNSSDSLVPAPFRAPGSPCNGSSASAVGPRVVARDSAALAELVPLLEPSPACAADLIAAAWADDALLWTRLHALEELLELLTSELT